MPAVVTVGALLASGAALELVLPSAASGSLAGGVANLLVQTVRYAGLVAVAVWLAARLEERSYADFGLDADARWLRDAAAGALASLVGIGVSLWWGDVRGLRELEFAGSVSAPDGALAVAVVLAVYAGYFLAGNVYEEVVFRRIALGNLAEGLVDRGLPPGVAVAAATAGSLALFGLYHVPLRPSAVVAVDAALTGVTFAVAYLVAGDLGLPLGVHFGRIPLVFASGRTVAGVDVPAFVAVTRNTLAANLEVRLVQLGVVCALVLAWVGTTRGELGVAASVWRPSGD